VKFTLSWLRAHLDTSASLTDITDTLTRIGLELESVTNRGAALASFRIARVVEAVQHPNADRLRACKVDAGDGQLVSVVCGAPNARTGMKAVFAAPGSFIPGTGITLKIGEIRGVQSAGMLLSAREMGLGEDHDGIVDLPEDAPVGTPYATWAGLDDPLIDISVTPNRGDALAVRGVARDLAAAGLGTLKPWAAARVPSGFASPLRWEIADPACPWVLGRTVRGVRNGPSPNWLADRLIAIGLRPINALVDITNFFTIDLGRPLHVFDVGKVSGDVLTMRPGAGETFRALNAKDYTATPDDCVIADATGVVSLAGVMGGAATGCDANTATVFVECALFDPIRVALTGRRHQIVSDARQRFERGVDPALLPEAVEAATRMILDLCGGEASDVVAAGEEPAWQRTASLRFSRVASLGGLDVPAEESVASLQSLGFAVVERDAEQVTVTVPSWRNDIAARTELDPGPMLDAARAQAAAEGRAKVEAEADLVEEVLRLKGLDAVPPVSMPQLQDSLGSPVPQATLTARQARTALARRTLAAQGLAECVTFSFMAEAQAALFGATDPALRLVNPIAADLDQLRATPVATLATAAARNAARGWPDVALFEVGPGYRGVAPEAQPLIAAGLRAGNTPRHWQAASRPVDAMDAKADALAVLEALGVPMPALTVTADAPGFYHPGRSGTVRQGPKTVLATFGALHPRVVTGLDTPGPLVAFEVFLDAIPDPKRRRRSVPELPTFMPLRRDFAFLVAADVSAEAVLKAARAAERTLIDRVSLFDAYSGDKIEPSTKSLGVEVVFQPRERTLTDAEIEAACAKVTSAVAKATGGRLR
jgi:phenylalanyl-tRNA synthetase beta chain